MIGELLVLQQSSTLAVLTVLALFRAEQITDGIGRLIDCLYLRAFPVVRLEKVVPWVVVEKNGFTREFVHLTMQAIAHAPIITHAALLETYRKNIPANLTTEHITLRRDAHSSA